MIKISKFLFKFLYERFEGVYLLVKRVQFFLLNPTCEWSATFKLSTDDYNSDDLLEVIMDFFRDEPSNICERKKITDSYYEVSYNKIKYSLSTAGEIVQLQSTDNEIGYRDSKKKIENSSAHLSSIQQFVGQKTNRYLEINYALKVTFQNNNPYMTVYLRRIKRGKVKTFECRYEYKDANSTTRVSINKNSILIIANDPQLWYKYAIKVLHFTA